MQKSILFVVLLFGSLVASAQVTPQPSPGARFAQTVGITEVKVEYSRPGVKGRKIFGGLLPYGKIWRTGANASTKISFSSDVLINNLPLSAGTYAVMSIPGENTWQLIFTTDLEVTEDTYNEQKDALRLLLKPTECDFTESFTIAITEVNEDQALMKFFWEKTAVQVVIGVNNQMTIENAIDARNNETAGAFLQAAEYLLNRQMDLNKALEYVEKSISLRQTFRNTWVKSIIVRQRGDTTEALKLAYKAKHLGQNDPVYEFFSEAIDKAIDELSQENLPTE
ncbi:DUF2911 domain-containing protein [Jiulongibacter sp. NS-SX5]|uniref:DUF2911 domain-containing protein n=1 Tax=Jiulongibacter sp. NS-SX5 TaxID=3463854 RepID=UPI00405A1B69